jgi:hypothetical protein
VDKVHNPGANAPRERTRLFDIVREDGVTGLELWRKRTEANIAPDCA